MNMAPLSKPESNVSAGSSASLAGPVLLVTPWYRPSVGGIVECVDILHRVLMDAGVETSVLVVEEIASEYRVRPHESSPSVWTLKVPSYMFYSRGLLAILGQIRRAPSTISQVFRFLRAHDIRTVILNYPSGYSWVFLLAQWLLGIKLVSAYLGNDLTKYEQQVPAMQRLTRLLLRRSDAVTVCGKHMVALAEKITSNGCPIHLFPNCMDTDRYVPAPASWERTDRPTILHVSIFAPKKRTLDIVEAFAIAKLPPEARLVMVGDGHDAPAAKELARRLGLESRVEFPGAQRDVRPYFWNADIFVLASDDEGAPLVLVEALACGVPFVSTPWGVAADLPSGQCGVTVQPKSPKQLAAAMEELLKSPETRHAMAKRGREFVVLELSAEAHRRRYLDLIRQLEA